ncbi:MAG TPA: hypothetical protein VD948_05285, partial [Rhodothermales bacterium]|nr:hypothetical protein [Rhodothermales bacterium]
MAHEYDDAPGTELPPTRWRFIEEERPRRRRRSQPATSGDGATGPAPVGDGAPAPRRRLRWLGPFGRYPQAIAARIAAPETRKATIILL